MSFPNTLLFTPTPPGEGSVGENYLRQICNALPQDKICCYAAWSSSYGDWTPAAELNHLPLEFTQLRGEPTHFSGFGALLEQIHSCFARRAYWRTLSPVIEEVAEFGLAHGSEVFLSIISTPETVRMTRKIHRRLNASLVLYVSELPQTTMSPLGYDPISRSSVIHYFKDLLATATQCIVSTEEMRERLWAEYQIAATLLTQPIQHRLPLKLNQKNIGGRFVIAHSETSRVEPQLISLLQALKALNWEAHGKPIVLKVIGNVLNFPLYAAGPNARLEFVGRKTYAEDLETLSDCDLAYVPGAFAEQSSACSKTRAMEELVSSIAAGIPVLYHGPEDSSPARFVKRHSVGISCHSLDSAKVGAAVKAIAGDLEFRKQAYEAGDVARSLELNPNIFKQNLYELLGGKRELVLTP